MNFPKEMALGLYTAILVDTNCFRYASVSSLEPMPFDCQIDGIGSSARMLFTEQLYGPKNINHIKFLGQVLINIQSTEDKKIAWLSITEELLEHYGVDIEDTNSFINNLLILEDIQVVCMFRATKDHTRVSFRGAGKVDVEAMARVLGGGGHYHSAAVVLKGNPEDVSREVVGKIHHMLSKSE